MVSLPMKFSQFLLKNDHEIHTLLAIKMKFTLSNQNAKKMLCLPTYLPYLGRRMEHQKQKFLSGLVQTWKRITLLGESQ